MQFSLCFPIWVVRVKVDEVRGHLVADVQVDDPVHEVEAKEGEGEEDIKKIDAVLEVLQVPEKPDTVQGKKAIIQQFNRWAPVAHGLQKRRRLAAVSLEGSSPALDITMQKGTHLKSAWLHAFCPSCVP